VRRWHFAVSEVVRAYVEARFGLNATDLTTQEILARLDEGVPLDGRVRSELERFLFDTDRVKFASHVAGADEVAATYERALSFVERTTPVARAEAA
jgi:hypothetical protein